MSETLGITVRYAGTCLFRAEWRWGGYTISAIDHLIWLAKEFRKVCNAGSADGAPATREDQIAQTFKKRIKEASVEDEAPFEFTDDVSSILDCDTEISMQIACGPEESGWSLEFPEFFPHGSVLMPTLAEELENNGFDSVEQLVRELGFKVIGDNPMDCAVYICLRDGIPMSEGALIHMEEMIELAGAVGGFIADNAKLGDRIIVLN